MALGWMAWTWETAAFFGSIILLLVIMAFWEILKPGGAPRRGILGLNTTRGDRLFISLLGSAYLNLAWLAFTSISLWYILPICLIYTLLVFKWV